MNALALRPWPVLTVVLLVALLACNIYRASTQSITTDEAFTYNLFLAGGFGDIFFHSYDAANHVLHTVLCKLSISAFGTSELTLRLPSLCGGALYFCGVFALCARLFRNSPAMLLSAGLLAMSPGILDYLSAARGYGLALACFTWCIYELWLSFTGTPAVDRLRRAGVVAGLAIGANLTFLFPILATGAAVALLSRLRGVIRFLTPTCLIPLALYALPLAHAHRDNFEYGARTLRESLLSVVFLAFAHHPPQWTDLGELNVYWHEWQRLAVAMGCIGVLLIGFALSLPAMIRNRAPVDTLLLLCYGSLFGSVLAAGLAHALFGVVYPQNRTGIYLVFLCLLTCAALIAKFDRPDWIGKSTQAGMVAVALFCLVQFTFQFCLTHYAEWPTSAGSRQIARELTALHGTRSGIRVGASYELEPDLNFYRQIWKLSWMETVDKWLLAIPYDFYVLAPEDAELVGKLQLTTRYEDQVLHVVVAERAPEARTSVFWHENTLNPLTYVAKAETIREKNVF